MSLCVSSGLEGQAYECTSVMSVMLSGLRSAKNKN